MDREAVEQMEHRESILQQCHHCSALTAGGQLDLQDLPQKFKWGHFLRGIKE
jgi:hypothetical protein